PLHSELIWYPLGIDLVLYTYNFFHALIAQPLMLAFNLPVASNIALLFSTVMSGYGTFLLVRYVLESAKIEELRLKIGGGGRLGDWEIGRLSGGAGDRSSDGEPISQSPNLHESPRLPNLQSSILIPAFLAGLIYAFASNRAIYAALGHYDMVTTQWIPFYALMLLRVFDGRLHASQRRKAALLGGFFFALNGLAEMITAVFLAIFTLLVVVDYGLRLWKEHRDLEIGRLGDWETEGDERAAHTQPISQSPNLHQSPRLPNLQSSILNLVLLGAVAFLLWSPALVPILRQFLTDNFALKGWGEAIPLSTDLLGWFTPTVLHPVFGGDLVA
ncbi:MAG: hypothetical protein KC423_26890, partial [Anaerolineales bacterium]|nr:hypothetical protein [Anaerolineales bacterium]